jgi:DNA-directed RNA polymerase specialized sigma24 family protein
MKLTLKEGTAVAHPVLSEEGIIRSRAGFLDREGKDLIEAVLIRGQSASAVARFMGVSPRTVRARVVGLTRRMSSRSFMEAATALPHLDPDDRAIALAFFCQGVSQRELCRRTGLTAYGARRRLEQVSTRIAIIRAVRDSTEGRPPWREEP